MRFGEPEPGKVPPCSACACRGVFRDLARPGEHERSVLLRCCQCGRERSDLEFYEQ